MSKQISKPEPQYVIVKVCKKCGAETKAHGNFIYHKSGTISFQAYNMESECVFCSEKYAEARKELGVKYQ